MVSVNSRQPSDGRVETESQHDLADRVRASLHAARVAYAEHVHADRVESWNRFLIKVPPQLPLEFEVAVSGDQFWITANSAVFYVQLSGFSDETEWVQESEQRLNALLRADLRIRVRNTWFWGNTGAIWVPAYSRPGTWSGDLLACRGIGKEFLFSRPWYELAEEVATAT